MGITDHLDSKTAQKLRRNKYLRFSEMLAKAKTPEEERNAEMRFLSPEVLPKVPLRPDVQKAYDIRMYFFKKEDFDLFCSIFKVNLYCGANTYKTDAIVKFLKLLESGAFKYQEETNRLTVLAGGKRYVF